MGAPRGGGRPGQPRPSARAARAPRALAAHLPAPLPWQQVVAVDVHRARPAGARVHARRRPRPGSARQDHLDTSKLPLVLQGLLDFFACDWTVVHRASEGLTRYPTSRLLAHETAPSAHTSSRLRDLVQQLPAHHFEVDLVTTEEPSSAGTVDGGRGSTRACYTPWDQPSLAARCARTRVRVDLPRGARRTHRFLHHHHSRQRHRRDDSAHHDAQQCWFAGSRRRDGPVPQPTATRRRSQRASGLR